MACVFCYRPCYDRIFRACSSCLIHRLVGSTMIFFLLISKQTEVAWHKGQSFLNTILRKHVFKYRKCLKQNTCVYTFDCVQSKNFSAVKSLIRSDLNHKYNCSVIACSIYSLVLCVISENATLDKVLFLEVPSTFLCWQNKKDKNGFSSKTQEPAFRPVRYLCLYVWSF